MAQCAKDKLQASAHQIWSSIRSFDETNHPTGGNGEQQQQSTNEEGNSSAQPTTTENTAAMSLEKIENVLKVMFGSCTAGIPMPHRSPPSEPVPTTAATGSMRRSRSSRSRDFVAARDMGEHVYEQLFMDDQARATRAVEGLRAKSASTPPSKSPSRHFSSYFGASSNTPLGHSVPAAAASPSLPLATSGVDVNGDFDFDDGISAISNHTLEEMAMVHDHRQSVSPSKQSTTNTTSSKNNGGVDGISHPLSNRSRRRVAPTQHTTATPTSNTTKSQTPRSPLPVHPMPSMMTPIKVSRGPSQVTVSTKTSKCTKSTSSTQDSHSEFASVWRKEEAKYWDNEVQKEKKTKRNGRNSTKSRRRSRSGSHSVSKLLAFKRVWFNNDMSFSLLSLPCCTFRQSKMSLSQPRGPLGIPTFLSLIMMWFTLKRTILLPVRLFFKGTFPRHLSILVGSRNALTFPTIRNLGKYSYSSLRCATHLCLPVQIELCYAVRCSWMHAFLKNASYSVSRLLLLCTSAHKILRCTMKPRFYPPMHTYHTTKIIKLYNHAIN